MNGVVTLLFDELPPGLNGRGGLLRMHWTARQDLNQRWHILAREAVERAHCTVFFDPEHPCNLLAVRYDRRMMDWDNLGASLKPVLDGLVKCGVLTDDGPSVVRALTLRQIQPPKGQRVKLALILTPLNNMEG